MRNRLIIFVAVAASLAWSCVRVERELPDNSISFHAVASRATKAIISGNTYPTSESFVVNAYYNGSAAYFQNLTASYNSTSHLWETATPEYWPLSGSLDFYAVSPASASGSVSVSADGISAQDYTIRTTAQMQTDLCFAQATVANCDSHPASVPMQFSHALSQVVFRVKAARDYSSASSTVALALRSLSLGGVYSVADYESGAWGGHSSAFTYNLFGAPASPMELTIDGETGDPDVIEVCAYLLLPQEIPADATITIGYDMVQTISAVDYTLENAPVSVPLKNTITEWEPGKKYVYTISVGMDNLITFTASAVSWQSENTNIIVEEDE